jgi:ketosteroid isomerase-like protein
MSEQNVEIVERVFERWGEGDFRAGVDVLDPHVVLVLGREFPDAGAYFGVDGVNAYMRGFLEPWTHLTMEAEELVAAGDSVLVSVRQRGVGTTSGVETELRYFQLWSFRGGKVIRMESTRDRAEALEAVGLSE